MKFSKGLVAGIAGLATALTLTACGSEAGKDAKEAVSSATSAVASAADKAEDKVDAKLNLEFMDAWVRASKDGSDMTGIFGKLVNKTDENIKITGFTSEVKAAEYQLHEFVNQQMQQAEGGFTVNAGETLELKPGGFHLMLMGMEKPLQAGEDIDITLMLSDGTKVDVDDIPVRDAAAGEENYGDLATTSADSTAEVVDEHAGHHAKHGGSEQTPEQN